MEERAEMPWCSMLLTVHRQAMRFKAADKNMKNKKSYFGGGEVRVNE